MIDVHKLHSSEGLTDYYNKVFAVSKGVLITKLKYLSYFSISILFMKILEFALVTPTMVNLYNILLFIYAVVVMVLAKQLLDRIKFQEQKDKLEIVSLLMDNEELEQLSNFIKRDTKVIESLDKVISEVAKNNRDESVTVAYTEDKLPKDVRNTENIGFPNLLFTRNGHEEFFVSLGSNELYKYSEVGVTHLDAPNKKLV